MGIVNLGQVAALIQDVTVEILPEGAAPTVRNAGTKANAIFAFGLPDVITTAKVEAKIEAAEARALELIDSKLINYFKNGYIQLPGMPSPLEDTSLHFEGYSWYEVNYDGNFFRAKGRNANPFSSTRFTMEQIKNGAYVFEADEQGDAIREILGSSKTDINFTTSELKQNETGAFFRSYAFGLPYKGSSGDLVYGDLVFRASRVVPTAEENRSRNLTFTIWALVKDE